MIDLTRLMFDDGATRKPINPGTPSTIYFTHYGTSWAATVVRDPDDLKNPPGRGVYLYSGKDNQAGGNSYWGFDRFCANPTAVAEQIWVSPTNGPGRQSETYHPDLLNSDVVFLSFERVSP